MVAYEGERNGERNREKQRDRERRAAIQTEKQTDIIIYFVKNCLVLILQLQACQLLTNNQNFSNHKGNYNFQQIAEFHSLHG